MTAHEFLPVGEDGRRWCKYCGALWHAQMTATCLERPGPPAARAPFRSALDDIDGMFERIRELRRDEVHAARDLPAGDYAATFTVTP